MKSREKRECWIYAIGMMILAEAFSWFQPIYTNVDNFIISMVINRQYGEDTYNMFLNPVLCWITATIGKIFSDADGFTLVTKITLLAGIGTISYFIAAHFRQWVERLFFCFVLFLLIVEMNLFSDYFMVWAAFFSFVGMVVLLHNMRSEIHKNGIAIGTFFLCCGLMLRLSGFALFIPFILLDIGVNFLFAAQNKKERIQYFKKFFRVFGPAIVCIFILLCVDFGYKHSEKYEDSVNFCDAVSMIVDFPMKEYDEVKDSIPDITQNDYESLENYLYADTDRITTAYCLRIGAVGKKSTFSIELKEIPLKVYSLIARFYGLINFRIWCLSLLAIGVLYLLSPEKWYYKGEICLAGAGAFLILLCLMLAGRLPERIMQSVLYAVMGIMIVCMADERKERTVKLYEKIGVVVLFAAVVWNLRSVDFTEHQSLWNVKTGAEESKWETLYEEDEVYIWRSSEHRRYLMRDFMKQGKLISTDFFAHNISAGGWDFNQVYYKELMEKLGVPNPVWALVNRKKTYYVASDCTNMWTYLKEHYDAEVQVEQVDEIDGIPVWQFQ